MTGGPKVLLDLTPVRRSADFRRLLVGSLVSGLGTQMTTFAVALQVWELTRSPAAVGGVGLAAFVPSVVGALVGGPVIDAVDRRRLVLVTSSSLMAVSALFAAQAFAGLRSVWLLYGLVAVQYLLASVNGPARRTFTPRLLPPELLASGAALQMLVGHTGVVAGPLLAAGLVQAGGVRLAYAADVLTFVAALYGVARLPAMRPEGGPTRPGPRAALDGARFVLRRRVLGGALLSDLAATSLSMPLALFPAVNAERFGGEPATLGLLSAALAAGGVLGTVLSGPVAHVRRQGSAMLVCVAVWGAALVSFGVAGGLAATLVALAVAGVADVLSVVFRTAIVQTVTPDAYRGRVSSAEHVVGAAGPQLGSFRAGVVAEASSTTLSGVTGGLSSLVVAGLIAVAVPALRRYRAPSDDPGREADDAR